MSAGAKFSTWECITRIGFFPNDCGDDGAEPEPEESAICRAWIRVHVEPTKAIQTRMGSYGWKHMVEDSAHALGASLYVRNGSFIMAALAEGYRAVRYAGDDPNGFFNMRVRKPGSVT